MVTILRPIRTPDSYGQIIESFETEIETFMGVSMSGSETFSGERLQYQQVATFTGHYYPLSTTWRLLFAASQWNIISVEKMQLGRFMRIVAAKIVE